jgi:hypothetical protein
MHNFCGRKGHMEDKCRMKDPSKMPAYFCATNAKKKGVTLSFVDMCDDVILDAFASICLQVDIQDAYISIPIVSIDYRFGHGFGNVIDDEDLPDLETPTEYEDADTVCSNGKQAVPAR